VTQQGLELREVAPGWTAEEVQERTGANLIVRGAVPEMKLG
jgi:acyl CoA:acetate/3-ketoacid CoA transferase beta subunit